MVNEFKLEMMCTFEILDLGHLHYFLGLEIDQSDGRIFMAQKKYVNDLLMRFNMKNCKMVPTLMNTNEKLQLNDDSGKVKEDIKVWLEVYCNFLIHILI